jgi:hypothetical protein
MLMAPPVASTEDFGNLDETDAELDGVLLNQTGLLASLITEGRAKGSAQFLESAELMRIVKSHQALLSAGAERAVDRTAEQAQTSSPSLTGPSRWQATKRKGRVAIALSVAIGAAAALYGFLTRA